MQYNHTSELCTNSNPSGDISIKYIGLRPGEKMYEELLINDNSKSLEPLCGIKILLGRGY